MSFRPIGSECEGIPLHLDCLRRSFANHKGETMTTKMTFVAAMTALLAAQPIAAGAVTVEAGALKLTWSKTGRITRVQCDAADLTG